MEPGRATVVEAAEMFDRVLIALADDLMLVDKRENDDDQNQAVRKRGESWCDTHEVGRAGAAVHHRLADWRGRYSKMPTRRGRCP